MSRRFACELAALGIDYERWSLDRVGADGSADVVLDAYADEIEEMKRRGGYVTADVIDVNPETPNLEAMLARFDKEHTHSEDEVRFILAGRGIFFLNIRGPRRFGRGRPWRHASCAAGHDALVYAVRGSPHPRHSLVSRHDGLDAALYRLGSGPGYQPLCFGPAYLGSRATTGIAYERRQAEALPSGC